MSPEPAIKPHRVSIKNEPQCWVTEKEEHPTHIRFSDFLAKIIFTSNKQYKKGNSGQD